MPIQVEVPGRGIVEFPDGTPPNVMEQALADFAQRPGPRTRADITNEMSGSEVLNILMNEPGPGGALLRSAAQGGLTTIAGPDVLSQLLSKGAARLYQGLAKPAKALRQEFSDLVPTALRERIPLTQRGARMIEQKLASSADEAKRIIAQHNPVTVPIRPKEIVPSFRPVVQELKKRADIGQPSQLGAVGQRGRRLMKGQDFSLARAQELKQTAQTAAQGAYRAKDRGLVKELSADDLLDEATARGLREAIERRVPEIASVNQRTQQLLGVNRMVDDALSREGNTLGIGGMRDLIAAGAGGGLGAAVGMPAQGAAVGLLMRILSSPGTGSYAAILANDAARLGLPKHALRALMASHEQEQ